MDLLDSNKSYVITGGSGFLGAELIKRLDARGIDNITVIARDEGKLIEIKELYPFAEVITGNIDDQFAVQKACQGADGIFHLAAYKHVGMAEEHSRECVQSNVLGTLNLLEYTRVYKPEFIIGISSDKAAQVKGVYGATKLLQEALFKEYERVNPDTKYRTVRYGNVLYSTGSVLCKWRERMEKGLEVIITDPNATRFFWTVDQAVDLIFECLENAKDSTPTITKMKAMRMGDLLEAMMEKYGKVDVKEIGLQPGENMHETIDGEQSSENAERYTKEEIFKLI